MKLSKISVFAASIALLCSCNAGAESAAKQDEAAEKTEEIIRTEAQAEAEVEAPAAAAEAVVTLSDDARYTPSTKVERPTLLDFNAVWCGPCRQFAPTFHAVAEKFAGKADFISVDTDANPTTATAFGIQVIPTVVILMPDGSSRSLDGRQLLPEGNFERIVAEITK